MIIIITVHIYWVVNMCKTLFCFTDINSFNLTTSLGSTCNRGIIIPIL